MAIRLFEIARHAQLYSKFRPTYPTKVLDLICNFIAERRGGFDLAVDVACGAGQSTGYLASRFKHCIGVDISAAQVECARKRGARDDRQNVEFKVGSAAEMPLEDGMVDLVTCAQAWHWLDPDKFYQEVNRVLKPNGCLAVYGYGNVELSNSSCNKLVSNFYKKTLKGYWHSGRIHIDDCYRQVVLPYHNSLRHDLRMDVSMSLPGFTGYLSSWSGYQTYCETNPGNTALEDLQQQLGAILATAGVKDLEGESALQLTFPVFILLGQK